MRGGLLGWLVKGWSCREKGNLWEMINEEMRGSVRVCVCEEYAG